MGWKIFLYRSSFSPCVKEKWLYMGLMEWDLENYNWKSTTKDLVKEK